MLSRASISNRARLFIGWFGLRGLNSLLLALLVIHAGVANSEYLLAIVGVVVTVSVVARGASAMPLSQAYGKAVEGQTHEEERENVGGIFRRDDSTTRRIGPAQRAQMLDSGEPPVVLDVRTRSQFEQDRSRIPGAIRLAPDDVDNWVREHTEAFDRRARIVGYCT